MQKETRKGRNLGDLGGMGILGTIFLYEKQTRLLAASEITPLYLAISMFENRLLRVHSQIVSQPLFKPTLAPMRLSGWSPWEVTLLSIMCQLRVRLDGDG